MKIGIDIDDTLVDTSARVKKYKKKYCKENNLDYHKSMKLELFNDFYTKYGKEIIEDCEFKKDAIKYIKRLNNLDFEIYFITRRSNKHCEKMMEYTLNSLNKANIVYKDILFDIENKAKEAQKLDIDIFIDDNISVLKKFDDIGKNVYLIHTQNKGEPLSIYDNAKSWKEIYKLIIKYKEGLNGR